MSLYRWNDCEKFSGFLMNMINCYGDVYCLVAMQRNDEVNFGLCLFNLDYVLIDSI